MALFYKLAELCRASKPFAAGTRRPCSCGTAANALLDKLTCTFRDLQR